MRDELKRIPYCSFDCWLTRDVDGIKSQVVSLAGKIRTPCTFSL